METSYKPIMNDVKIIDNVASPMFLEYVRYQIQESENWSWQYPKGAHFSKRHPKLTLIDGTDQPPKVERLAGIAMSLFLMVYEKGLHGTVFPELMWAGASIKDKHREDNTHTDHMDVFDPRVPHMADNILCDEKRIAIDYTVRAI